MFRISNPGIKSYDFILSFRHHTFIIIISQEDKIGHNVPISIFYKFNLLVTKIKTCLEMPAASFEQMNTSSVIKRRKKIIISDSRTPLITEKELLTNIPSSISYSTQSHYDFFNHGKSRIPNKVYHWENFTDMVKNHLIDNTLKKYEKPSIPLAHAPISTKNELNQVIDLQIIRSLTSKLNHDDLELCKNLTNSLIDWNVINEMDQIITSIASRTRRVLRTNNDYDVIDAYNHNIGDFADNINEVYDYMCELGLKYSILTTYEFTWFIKRTSSDDLLISNCQISDSINPTILQSWNYLLYLSKNESLLPPCPIIPKNHSTDDYLIDYNNNNNTTTNTTTTNITSTTTATTTIFPSSSTSTFSSSITPVVIHSPPPVILSSPPVIHSPPPPPPPPPPSSSTTTIISSSSSSSSHLFLSTTTGKRPASSDVPDLDFKKFRHDDTSFNSLIWNNLILKNEIINDIYLAEYNNQDLAIKFTDGNNKRRFDLEKEARIYKRLSSIQGVYIPKLKFNGLTSKSEKYVLATDYIVKTTRLFRKHKDSALNTIKAIHSLGIIQNDIRDSNFVVGLDDRVFIIDFRLSKDFKEEQSAQLSSYHIHMEKEKEMVEDLFNNLPI